MRLKHGVELVAGIALGLCFFLVLLWLMNVMFPNATGLGLLARSGDGDGSDRSLVLDGFDRDTEVIAQLSNVRRAVKDRSPLSVVWSHSQDGLGLGDRHAVQSPKGGGATIAFDAKNHLELDESTLVVVRRPNRFSPTRSTKASVLIVDGTLRGKLSRSADDSMDVGIVTGGGTIRAHGDASTPADFRVSATKSGAATVSVLTGTVDVQWGGTSTPVPADHAVMFGLDGGPKSLVPLPVPPHPDEPGQEESFVYRTIPPRISFAWSAVESADRYRLEIARDVSFEEVVHETVVSEPRFVHGHLRENLYFWRVTALAGGAEGRPGVSRQFRVTQDRQPPSLMVHTPDGPVRHASLTLRGRSEPGARVVVGEISVTADHSGEFAMGLDLRTGYNLVVVQAIDAAGNTAFVTREVRSLAAESGSRQ